MSTTDPEPAAASFVVGTPYRALRTLRLWIYTWDELELDSELLREGSIFQPWEPSAHARGKRVPITVGDAAAAHGWDADHPRGLFLDVLAFESACQPAALPVPSRGQPFKVREPGPSVFEELPALLARLVRPAPAHAAEQLYELAREHDAWRRYELAASSFDNTESMRDGADRAAAALARARALLADLRRDS